MIGLAGVLDEVRLAVRAPTGFGLAVADVSGQVCGVGEFETPFPVQSIAKLFTFALVLAADGQAIWRRVGRSPSADRYDSPAGLAAGIPPNPFVNAGALVATDRLHTLTGDACGTLRSFLSTESGNPALRPHETVVAEELAGHRNAALAHLLAGAGNLDNPVEVVLGHYARQCAITMSCREVALAARFLARDGVLAAGARLLSASDTKRLNATTLVCGTYQASGEVAYRVGLPAKSGIGGGIVAVVPGQCAVCVWSPALDEFGNSVAGVAALEAFATLTGWSVF